MFKDILLYIYIYIERERDIHIHIYIYMYYCYRISALWARKRRAEYEHL